MKSYTVEFHRLGSPEAILDSFKDYIRTIGQRPATQLRLDLDQHRLERLLKALEPTAGTRNSSRLEDIDGLENKLRDFLGLAGSDSTDNGSLIQWDVVLSAKELAQLPFELLERTFPGLVMTRRVRYPTLTPPKVDRSHEPKVLFVWAEPPTPEDPSIAWEVPHRAHRQALEEVLGPWFRKNPAVLDEVKNIGPVDLIKKLRWGKYTHVHILAHGHGEGDGSSRRTGLALNEGGDLYLAFGSDIADALARAESRPRMVTLATCHSARVNQVTPGGSLAQAVHEAGVPIVLGSQFALTKVGSKQLVDTFLRKDLEGEDPRAALKSLRLALRENEAETHFDDVSVLAYLQLNPDFEASSERRRLKISLSRLKAASGAAWAGASESTADVKALEAARKDLEEALEDLQESHSRREKHFDLLEEGFGLTASAHKRIAEVEWRLSHLGVERKESSRRHLRLALASYQRASDASLDHHWTSVQYLALKLVTSGRFDAPDFERWIVTRQAAERTRRAEPDDPWPFGTLAELAILARGHPHLNPPNPREALERLVEIGQRKNDRFSIRSTIDQLHRYATWWAKDHELKLPSSVAEEAGELARWLTDKANTSS